LLRGAFCLLAAIVAGCGPGSSSGPQQSPVQQAAAPSPQASPAAEPAEKGKLERQTWEVCSIQKARVGYAHTAEYRVVRDGRPLVRIVWLNVMRTLRAGKPMETRSTLTSLETPDGKLLEFTCRTGQETVSMVVEGRVAGDKADLTVTTMGKTTVSSIPWSPEYLGFFAMDQSPRRQPMKPGERRTLRGLVPLFNQVAETELVARQYEPVQLLDGTRELLRVDGTTKLEGQTVQATAWCDRAGETWRLRSDTLDLETYRTTKEVALGESAPAKVDLILTVAVPVDRPLPRARDTKRIRYRVRLEGGDPASAFVVGPSQQVRSIDANTAEITVVSCRLPVVRGKKPTTDNGQLTIAENRQLATDNCLPGDREPNNFIQSDNPKIIAAARKAAGDLTDPWQVAVALERAVGTLITKPDYSQAFASAAEVIESGTGDCTEHAVLLAALARARGIPARVALGLVYGDGKFLYHAWTEVFIDGQWTGLDGTRGRGGIDAAYLKLGHSNLQGASALAALLPVAQVAGRLKIEIVEVE
jgi:hypothetical protein